MRIRRRRASAATVLLLAAGLSVSGFLASGCSGGPAPGRGPETPETNAAAPASDDAVLERERKAKDDFFRSGDSPLPAEGRDAFRGLPYYPAAPSWRIPVRLQRYAVPRSIRMATNTGEVRSGLRYGFFEFEAEGRPCKVQVYRLDESAGEPALFIPFLDATSGTETYEGGRYIDLTENTTGEYVLDFNRAYNPYCAYNPAYSCPAPPSENRLDVPVRAGEKYSHAEAAP